MVKRIPGFGGLSLWILTDFHSPRRNLPGMQDHYNRTGLLSITGQRKQAFFVLQKFYREVEEPPATEPVIIADFLFAS
jgi:beta-glucuronidase